MRSVAIVCVLSCSLFLDGCATYNFAPPNVELHHVVHERESLNTHCGVGDTEGGATIHRTMRGAEKLTDNFLYAYRCAARQVANGRQNFEVPAMLIGLGGAIAAAAGAPAAMAIGTGGAVAGLNGGKAYYAPKDKLPILAASIDALVCVKDASVGIDPYGSSLITAATGVVDEEDGGTGSDSGKSKGKTKQDKSGATPASDAVAAAVAKTERTKTAIARAAAVKASPNGAQLAMSVTDQYFEMVEGALLNIENIAAQRLSSVGSYSPDAIITEFTSLQQQLADAKEKKDAQAAQADLQSPAVAAAAAGAVSTAPVMDNTDQATLPDGSATVTEKTGTIASLTADNISLIGQLKPELAKPGAVLAAENGKPIVLSAWTKADHVVPPDTGNAAITKVLVDIKQLQPQLNLCVMRAKL